LATYIIGDVQGCYESLLCLLERIAYDPAKDKLWFAGDLVNRGPDSLSSLRLIKNIASKVVLGNHDLHLLACFYGSKASLKKKDTFGDILAAPDCHELLGWLKQQPLMVWSKKKNVVMSHAGLPHIWSTEQAYALSKEVNSVLCSDDAADFFDHMYGNEPSAWSEGLLGMERLRVITNYLTRMRFVSDSGQLEFLAKESVDSAPAGFKPWFAYDRNDKEDIAFGHWAALLGKTVVGTGVGKAGRAKVHAIDTGCVWGGALTAMNVRTKERFACECEHP